MKLLSIFVPCALVACMFVIASAAMAADANPTPFGGKFQGQLTVIPPFAPGSSAECNANYTGDPNAPGAIITAIDLAEGVFSVMGSTRLEATSCIDPNSPSSSGSGLLIAASGDQAFIEFENLAGPDPNHPGGLLLTGSQWITGGTGRYEGASGTQECRIRISFTSQTTGVVEGSCLGTIQFAVDDAAISAKDESARSTSFGWVKSRF